MDAAHAKVTEAKAEAAAALKQQKEADTANQKAIGEANSAKQAAVDAHKKYIDFVKAGADRGMIH
jgi:hypothetical protein